MTDKRSYPLGYAERIAEAIVVALRPVCQRIRIAGSIRRRVERVHDIDLVIVPEFEKGGLFGDMPRNLLTDRLREWHTAERISIEQMGPKKIRFVAKKSGVPVELYLTDDAGWFTTLLIRTGSVAHNIWLCNQALAAGWKLHADGSGLERISDGEFHTPTSEEDIFATIGVSYKPPEERK